MKKIKELYWNLLWIYLEIRDALTVAQCLRGLRRHKLMYIHPNPKTGAVAVVVDIDTWHKIDEHLPEEDYWAHTHLEGKVRP